MRVGHGRLLLIVISGLFTVALAVAINVATGGQLPGPLTAYDWLAWPAVGVLVVVGIFLALWQWRLEHPPTDHSGPLSTFEFLQPAELPAVPDLVGRTEDIASAVTAAYHTRLLVIAAAPGIGKTALALRVAHDLRARFPDGQLYAVLRGASAEPVPTDTVLTRFLGAIGRPDDERRGTLDELAARFRSAVVDRKLLVVLDDAADGDQVRPLLPGGEGCLTIVTSRRLLDLPGALTVPLPELRHQEALVLLAATAGASRIAADPASADRLVAACAGLPLALLIVGARLRVRAQWNLAEMADRLDNEGRRLDELRAGDRAVRSTFLAAYQELSDIEQVVFRRAGSDPGHVFGVGAAAARCGLDEPTVSEVLNRLTDSSMVESPAPDRFRLHDLLRLFALEAFADRESAADRAACLAREAAWLRRTAQPGEWLARERDNVLSVVNFAVESGAADVAWSLVQTLHPLLTRSDDYGDRLMLWQAGETAATMLGDVHGRIRALRWISHSHGLAGRVTEELAPAQQALALAQQLGDTEEIAQTMRRLGEALRAQSRFAEAETALTAALDMFVELGRVDEEIQVRAALGTLYNVLWQPESSTPMYERAAQLLPPEESSLHGWVTLGLGLAYKFGGRRHESARLTTQAFAIAERLGDEYLLGYCHHERGWFEEEEGHYPKAERHFRIMLAIFEQIRHGSGVGAALGGLATIADKQGRSLDALADLEAGIDQYDRLNDRVHAGELRLHRSAILRKLGRIAESAREQREAESLIGDASVHRRPGLQAVLAEPLD